MTFHEVITLHPQPTALDREAILRCINECLDCGGSRLDWRAPSHPWSA